MDIPWVPIADQLRVQSCATLHDLLSAVPGMDQEALRRLQGAIRNGEEDHVPELLQSVCPVLARVPHGLTMLAAYLYTRARNAWESSTNYAPIRTFVGHIEGVTVYIPADMAPLEQNLCRVMVEHAESLIDTMAVESGLNNSDPQKMQDASMELVVRSTDIVEKIAALNAPAEDLGYFVNAVKIDANCNKLYFSAIKEVAEAVSAFNGWMDGNVEVPAATALFDKAIAKCHEVENAPEFAGDFYVGELRAHRVALTTMRDVMQEARLAISEGNILLVYPFALNAIDTEAILAAADGCAQHWPQGLPALSPPEELDLTDVWRGTDEHSFHGVKLRFPAPTVEFLSDDVECEVRLSALGNHAVCFQFPIDSYFSLHRLNQVLRSGSKYSGEQSVVWGSRDFGRLTSFVEFFLAEFTQCISRAAAMELECISDLQTHYHAIMGLRVANTVPGNDIFRYDPAHPLMQTRILTNPVRQAASALNEWVRYPDIPRHNFLEKYGCDYDLGIRTANTTLLYTPGTPNFLSTELEEMAYFVATLPPLLEAWIASLERYLDGVKESYAKLVSQSHLSVEEQDALDEAWINLRRNAASIFERVGFLKSTSLCDTIVQKRIVDDLYREGGIHDLFDDVATKTTAIENMFESLREVESARAKKAQDRQMARENKSRKVVEAALALVAVFSLADFFVFLNEALDLPDIAAYLEIGVMALGIVSMGYILMPRSKKGPKTEA